MTSPGIAPFHLLIKIIAGEIIFIQKNKITLKRSNKRIMYPLRHSKCCVDIFIFRHKSFMARIVQNRVRRFIRVRRHRRTSYKHTERNSNQ